MPYITISDGLTIKTPTAGTKNYFTTMYNDTFKKISAHDHTGSGKGLQLGANALQANAITFAKMQQITTDRLLGRDTAGTGAIEQLTVGSGLEFTGSGGIRATQSAIFTSGDFKMTLASSAPTDWLLMNGGTIGDATSGGTLRANADCATLFAFLWDNLANAQAAVSTGRGANAAADFAAHKTITVPDMRQKFPLGKAASGTGSVLGDSGGNIDHTHVIGSHTHTGPSHTHGTSAISADLTLDNFAAAGHTLMREVNSGTNWADNKKMLGGGAPGTASGVTTWAKGIGLQGSTDAGGTGATGATSPTCDTRNPPWLAVNFIIKI